MTFRTEQVAEILILESGQLKDSRGTGYLLFNNCVLTAFHVVQNCGDRSINVRLLGTYADDPSAWPSAKMVWHNQALDLALLKWTGHYNATVVTPKLKALDLSQEHQCRAYGFPRYNAIADGQGFDVDVLVGTIKPIESPKSPGQLRIQNDGEVPPSMDDWKGFSGGPVFAADELVGVIIEGPESLQGQRLEAIALEHCIKIVNAGLREHFNQELCCFDVEGIEASKLYDLSQELEALKLRQTLIALENNAREAESIYIRKDIDQKERQLAACGQDGRYVTRIAQLPKKRLEDLLVKIVKASEAYQDIFWAIWSEVGFKVNVRVGGGQNERQSLTVNDAYTLLVGAQDSERLSRFLAPFYGQLRDNGGGAYLDELRELATVICGVDLEQPAGVQTTAKVAPKPQKTLKGGQGCLLIKVESGDAAMDYVVNVWLVSERQLYQERIRGLTDSVAQPISQENVAESLVNGKTIQVRAEQTQAEEIKQALAEMMQPMWKEHGFKRIKPQVVFFVPIQLLDVDFHNIKWGARGDTLGREVPVSVSCLGRFDESEAISELISEYRDDWVDRWQGLEDFGDRPISQHLEYDEGDWDVDMTCPDSFYCWLQERDDDHEWQVSGLGLYSPCNDLAKAFMSFLLSGLPIVFWPSRVLGTGEVDSLKNRMNVVPEKILEEFKSCRLTLGKPTKNAGPVSILLDNPYLCPPDCEFDY